LAICAKPVARHVVQARFHVLFQMPRDELANKSVSRMSLSTQVPSLAKNGIGKPSLNTGAETGCWRPTWARRKLRRLVSE
jgi:hypothetical protein